MTAYLIMGAIIASMGGISFLIIKKLRKDKRELEFKIVCFETEIDNHEKNKIKYEDTIKRIANDAQLAIELKGKIDNSAGTAFIDILNKL